MNSTFLRHFCTQLFIVTAAGFGLMHAEPACAEPEHIYWTKITSTSRTIWRADGDGSNISGLASTLSGNPEDLALDVDNYMMYWITFDTTGPDQIQRVSMDGGSATEVEVVVASIDGQGSGIALDTDNGKIYWTAWATVTEPGRIYRANTDGSSVETLVSTGDRLDNIALDLTNGHMYWTDSGTVFKIQRANLDGTGVIDLLVEAGVGGPVWAPEGIALDVDGGMMYWTQGGAVPAVKRSPMGPIIDPDDIETLAAGSDGVVAPRDIALDLDAAKVYWTEAFDDMIMRANLDGSARETIVSPTVNCVGLALAFGAVADMPADIDGNGVVDVFDLLDLLAAWGDCDQPCPPSCPADITNSDGAGTDCTVNVFDLLLLLSNWG